MALELASDFQDRTPPIYRDDVCCFISQSGAGPRVRDDGVDGGEFLNHPCHQSVHVFPIIFHQPPMGSKLNFKAWPTTPGVLPSGRGTARHPNPIPCPLLGGDWHIAKNTWVHGPGTLAPKAPEALKRLFLGILSPTPRYTPGHSKFVPPPRVG